MDETFYSVAIPEPTTLLGLRLRQFSLGHLILLHRVQSAFVTPDEPMTIHDVALSVLICSLSYKEGCGLFEDPTLHRFMRRWHDKIAGVNWRTRIGWRKAKPIDFPAVTAAFSAYMDRGSSSPYYSYKVGEARSVECPTVQIVKVSLMRELGIPEAELMDRSWAMCLWDYITVRALDGNLSFENKDALKAAQEAAEQLAERLKGANGDS